MRKRGREEKEKERGGFVLKYDRNFSLSLVPLNLPLSLPPSSSFFFPLSSIFFPPLHTAYHFFRPYIVHSFFSLSLTCSRCFNIILRLPCLAVHSSSLPILCFFFLSWRQPACVLSYFFLFLDNTILVSYSFSPFLHIFFI